MAVLAQNTPFTLAEANKINGYTELGNLLSDFQQRNSFIDECPWYPTTHGSYTEEFRAKFLDEGDFTEINAGRPQLGSTGDIIKETVKIYEGESLVDDRLLHLADDPYRARDTRDRMNLEGMFRGFSRRLLYPKAAGDDKAIRSLTERKNKLDPGNFVFGAGGTGTGLTSAWLFEFGPADFHMVYNKAGSPGLKNEDQGMHKLPAPSGNGTFDAWVRKYEIIGNMIEGSRSCVMRYANISTDPADTGEHFNPELLITSMKPYLRDPSGRNAVLFVPPAVYGQIELECYRKANVYYTLREIQGYGLIPMILGIAIRQWDSISENESAIS
jgi:hypothetical protein